MEFSKYKELMDTKQFAPAQQDNEVKTDSETFELLHSIEILSIFMFREFWRA